ncbi:sensor histidine kinase [Streptomyces clavuligerus]|uniref:histidine kinase n=3 Tax=Streptomyces clavuligerus TaxID=1901 RepID=E2PW65_STRCL|nr:ATP-binding protein [Streptomyces clavuligerus]ANW21028.1 PAS domain-containing sensor histidine kinase [Streptomyces clavuligerus]EFG05898.1 putative two-component system sensor kinase [Streptomyces clavuligerus]WDN51074.1 PAS domain-containing protein [Streptomyces clavuligerus]
MSVGTSRPAETPAALLSPIGEPGPAPGPGVSPAAPPPGVPDGAVTASAAGPRAVCGGSRDRTGVDLGLGPGLDPDDLPDGLVVVDEGGRVICFNAAAARIAAVRAGDVIGRPLEKALPLEDLKGRRWWALTDPYGGLATRVGQPERNLLLPGGREVLVSARYVRERPTGPVRRLVVTLRGTEARRRTERSHAELIATVAHELRSPLTSVKGFTATLLAKWERFTDDQKRLMLETVDADASRVTRLIAELLDISRIDSGRLEVRRQPVDIAAAVGRHVQAHMASGQGSDRFFVRVRRGLPALWADPDKIDQVLGNLLENAVRHGAGTVTIEVAPVAATGGESGAERGTAVTVSDEGPGIPEESMSRVFTRFWRGSKRGGTGLGLYIVKGIVEAHGGTITVGRGPGGGAEFRFTLPVGVPAALA